MTDFETHPAGTADLVKRLRDEHLPMTRSEAADRIEQLEAENADAWDKCEERRLAQEALEAEVLRLSKINTQLCADFNVMNIDGARLELALTQSRAETAAAYEVATKAVTEARVFADDDTDGETAAKVIALGRAGKAIRALATADQTAALDAVRAEAWEQGMREAAEIASAHKDKAEDGNVYAAGWDNCATSISDAILAAIKGDKA